MRFKIKLSLFVSLILIASSLSASTIDGELVDRTLVSLDKNTIDEIKKIEPQIESIITKVDTFQITYRSDGLKIKGYVAIPKKDGTYPCVIFNRDGEMENGVLNDAGAVFHMATVASRGYVVIASQYRGNAGGEGIEEFGGSDLNDVLNLIPTLDNFSKADNSRLGMYGIGRGGMMTYLALKNTDKISAAVVVGGVSDLFSTLVEQPESDGLFRDIIPNYDTEKEEQLSRRSAIKWVDQLDRGAQILILHGADDNQVSANQALRMSSVLFKNNYSSMFVLFRNGNHWLSGHYAEKMKLIREWFDSFLLN
ncbi:MAG: prolyl oligopeptidase family serine peptidase [Bacteriovoracaceae bacterium]|nr:prolyl oligopeptidase family serine peptidase [Bacteriovoracaceae bacterium]